MSKRSVLTTETAIILVLIVALLAFLIPAMFTAQESPQELTITHEEGETINVTRSLTATMDEVNNESIPFVTITLTDDVSEETETVSLQNGNSITITMRQSDVTIRNDQILSNVEAEITYISPLDYGWDTGARQILFIIPTLIVAITLLFIWYLVFYESDSL